MVIVVPKLGIPRPPDFIGACRKPRDMSLGNRSHALADLLILLLIQEIVFQWAHPSISSCKSFGIIKLCVISALWYGFRGADVISCNVFSTFFVCFSVVCPLHVKWTPRYLCVSETLIVEMVPLFVKYRLVACQSNFLRSCPGISASRIRPSTFAMDPIHSSPTQFRHREVPP